jgi:MSHA biogenesis protein MshQ
MAVSYTATGATATGTTSASVPYPGAVTANDLLVIADANKYPPNVPATPAGYTLPTNGQVSQGSGTGLNAGAVISSAFYAIAAGGETGTKSVTATSSNTMLTCMAQLTCAAGKTWSVTAASGGGTGNNTDATWSVTAGQTLDLQTGDIIIAVVSSNDASIDLSTPGGWNISGATVTSVTGRSNSGNASGQRVRLSVVSAVVSANSATATLTLSGDASTIVTTLGTGFFLAATFLRIREITPPATNGDFAATLGAVTLAATATSTAPAVAGGGGTGLSLRMGLGL